MSKQGEVMNGQSVEAVLSESGTASSAFLRRAKEAPSSRKSRRFSFARRCSLPCVLLLAASLAGATSLSAQTLPTVTDKDKTHITPKQAKELFSLVDELIKYSSEETGLPIKSTVKRQLTNRTAVEASLKQKFEEDESAKRFQRSEVVLKKFGLLDRDFALKEFLLQLLKEQIEAYYDPKTKTVYMLDWVSIEEQKPVLAHELTHALQDQHSELDKWVDQSPNEVSLTAAADTDSVAKDEMDSARQAVAEGQATAVMMNYALQPMGKTLVKNPEVMEVLKPLMSGAGNAPMLNHAPVLLSESLLFPYREGLSFEQKVWLEEGKEAAFSGMLDHPPTSTWEIFNPREYERKSVPAVPVLPNIHPLVDALYKPYDIGQMGQLDVHMLTKTLGGEFIARKLTDAWDGGLYWAGQSLAPATTEPISTKSIALFYYSAWKDEPSAQTFASLYGESRARKSAPKAAPNRYAVYPRPKSPEEEFPDPPVAETPQLPPLPPNGELLYSTSEGPVLITVRGKQVFVAESFDLDLARKLTNLVFDAQSKSSAAATASLQPLHDAEVRQSLTGSLVHFLSNCGVMKAAVDAEIEAAAK